MATTYDVGDEVLLTFYTLNDAGALADTTLVVVTLTLPDQTTTTPAVTHAGTGVYTIKYATAQSGRYRVSPVATGAINAAQPDVFNVAASDPGFIISLDQARSGLNLAAGNTVKDEDLRLFVAAATPIIEDIVGPIVPRTVIDTFDGGNETVILSTIPYVSITSVVEIWGIAAYTLTNQPLGAPQDGYGYTIDDGSGQITRRATGASATRFPEGDNNVIVTYIAGRAIVPANVQLATRELVRHLWQPAQQGFRPAFGQSAPIGDIAYTPSGYAVPKRVIEMLSDIKQPSGMY